MNIVFSFINKMRILVNKMILLYNNGAFFLYNAPLLYNTAALFIYNAKLMGGNLARNGYIIIE